MNSQDWARLKASLPLLPANRTSCSISFPPNRWFPEVPQVPKKVWHTGGARYVSAE